MTFRAIALSVLACVLITLSACQQTKTDTSISGSTTNDNPKYPSYIITIPQSQANGSLDEIANDCEVHHTKALFDLGRLMNDNRVDVEAIMNGNNVCLKELIYFRGVGLGDQESIYKIRQLVKNRNAVAEFDLATLYNGEFVQSVIQKNIDEAIRLFRQSDEDGYRPSACSLGLIYKKRYSQHENSSDEAELKKYYQELKTLTSNRFDEMAARCAGTLEQALQNIEQQHIQQVQEQARKEEARREQVAQEEWRRTHPKQVACLDLCAVDFGACMNGAVYNQFYTISRQQFCSTRIAACRSSCQ